MTWLPIIIGIDFEDGSIKIAVDAYHRMSMKSWRQNLSDAMYPGGAVQNYPDCSKYLDLETIGQCKLCLGQCRPQRPRATFPGVGYLTNNQRREVDRCKQKNVAIIFCWPHESASVLRLLSLGHADLEPINRSSWYLGAVIGLGENLYPVVHRCPW